MSSHQTRVDWKTGESKFCKQISAEGKTGTYSFKSPVPGTTGTGSRLAANLNVTHGRKQPSEKADKNATKGICLKGAY